MMLEGVLGRTPGKCGHHGKKEQSGKGQSGYGRYRCTKGQDEVLRA